MSPALASFLIERNAKEIARDHKQFRQTLSLPWTAKWVGTLTPMFQEFVVEIEFTPGAADEEFYYPAKSIWITVAEPRLTGRDAPPTRIPHLYRYPTDTETARLCLFWPHDREWTKFMSIADFIIPWTSEWLANYELWKVSGRWPSPEAPHHVTPSNVQSPEGFVENPGPVEVSPQQTSAPKDPALYHETALPNLPYFFRKEHMLFISS